MNTVKELSPLLAGVSGEYFVAAELSKKEYIASITLRNTKGIDILCSNQEATKSLGIHVKTNRNSKRSWLLSEKSDNYFTDNLFYIFVNLNDNLKFPEFFIVPSKIVANFTKDSHSKWLNTPGKKVNPIKIVQ